MWWHNHEALEAMIADFIVDHLRQLGLQPHLRTADNPIVADEALRQPARQGLASLPYLDMAGRLARILGLDHTGLSDLLLARRSLSGWVETAVRSLGTDHRRIGFFTSGSTGTPAFHQHPITRLLRESRHFAERLPDHQRIVGLVPAHHIYGFLWTVLLPSALRCPSVRYSPGRHLPATLAGRLRDHDIAVATPDIWRMMLDHDVALPARFTAISSTAPLPRDTAQELTARSSGIRLLEVYGSTETAAIGCREHPDADWSLLPWWRFASSGSPAGSDQLIDRDDDTRHELNDHLAFNSGTRFHIHGRRDPVVQIAGYNINLEHIRQVLCQHPDVRDAAVRAGRDSLRFFLALHPVPDHPEGWCRQFQSWLDGALPDAPPASGIILGTALPRNAMNKASDWHDEDYTPITGRFRGIAPELLDSTRSLQ